LEFIVDQERASAPFIVNVPYMINKLKNVMEDINDLNWIGQSLKRGYSINWEKAGVVWKDKFIMDAKMFDFVLSVCPNPSACLASVHPRNLCNLIENQKSSSDLASRVLASVPLDYRASNSPYCTAAWKLIRENLSDKNYRLPNNDVLDVLLWASNYGANLNGISQDPHGSNCALQTLIEREANGAWKKYERKELSEDEISNILVGLYNNVFALFLSIADNIYTNKGLHPDAIVFLCAKCRKVNNKWPPFAKIISKIIQKKATPGLLSRLKEDPFFRHKDGSLRCPENIDFVCGLLEVDSLDVEWQTAILVLEVAIPNEYATKPGKLERSLYPGFHKLGHNRVKIRDGAVMEALKKKMEK